jgi:hypothetical protein
MSSLTYRDRDRDSSIGLFLSRPAKQMLAAEQTPITGKE